MSRMEDLISRMCPDGVGYSRLGNVCKFGNYRQLGASELESLIVPGGNIPLIPSSANYDWMTTEEVASDYICDGELFSMGRARNANTKYVKGKFVSANNFLMESADTSKCLTRFIFHFATANIKNIYVETSTYPKFDKDRFCNLSIPLPPLEVQREIVRILDTFTELEAELEAELTKRKQQFNHYQNEMLSFEDDVRWSTLGEECLCISGGTPSKKNSSFWGGDYKWLGSSVCKNKKSVDSVTGYITEEGKKKTKCMKPGTTLIALVGATIGKNAYLTFDAAINQNIVGIYPKDEKLILPEFVYYYSSQYYERFLELGKNGFAMANLAFVKSLPFPVISIEKQARIVDTMNSFSLLIDDISKGLPAEIEARHKQYEYYRDKLLTFKERVV